MNTTTPAATDQHGSIENITIRSTIAPADWNSTLTVSSTLDYFDPTSPGEVETDVETRWVDIELRQDGPAGYKSQNINLWLSDVRELRDALDSILAIKDV
jgi:hypothetical protein